MKVLSLLVLQLPETNYHTLRLLLRFLKDVVDHQSTNKMTATNVATVMGPNLFPLPPLDAKANRKNSAKTLSQGVNPPSIPDQFHSTPIPTSTSSSFYTTHPHLNSTRIFVFFFFSKVAYTAKANRVLELLLIHQDPVFVIPSAMQHHLLMMEFS